MWTLLWMFRKDGGELSIYSLAELPDAEHEAYYGCGFSRPLMRLKLCKGQKFQGIKPGDVFRLKVSDPEKSEGSRKTAQFHLCDPNDKKRVFRVKATNTAKNALPKTKPNENPKHCTLTVDRVLLNPEGKDDNAPLLNHVSRHGSPLATR